VIEHGWNWHSLMFPFRNQVTPKWAQNYEMSSRGQKNPSLIIESVSRFMFIL